MKKQLLAAISAMLLLASLTACHTDSGSSSAGEVPSSQTNSSPDSSTIDDPLFDDVLGPAPTRTPTADVNPNGIRGKVIAGYQGWFGAKGDGNTPSAWKHWSQRFVPGTEFGCKFDLYPDISEYLSDKLYPTDFGNFGDGSTASLFSSFNPETVDTHFRWMQEYGIDCAAVQRFASDITDSSKHALTVMSSIKEAAENHGRAFYLCYDVTGYSKDNLTDLLAKDYELLTEQFPKITDSPNYLRENGKPVVEIWGIGVGSNYKNTVEEGAKLIQYFKDQGCYVIGGVGAAWRSDSGDVLSGYTDIYNNMDMISPWLVGRFNTLSDIENTYKTTIADDKAYCDQRGIDYMPVLWPGFSWANWYPGAGAKDRNGIPRRAGETFWTQAKAAYGLDCTAYYLAMFDEYDESTAFAKAAEDSSRVPSDYWFLTLSADGTWLSGDFYLRLAGALSDTIRKGGPISPTIPVPYSEGPIYLRTSFEADLDVKARANAGNIKESEGFDGKVTVTTDEKAYMRETAVKLSGTAASESAHFLSAICNNLNIPVLNGMKLRYYKYAVNEGGKQAVMQILFTDGTRLEQPVAGGDVGKWSKMQMDLSACQGKTIQALALAYDGGPLELEAYFDDVLIYV